MIITMKKILFPTDFSETANNAFVYALNIAHKLGAEIVTLHAYQLPDVNDLYLPPALREVYDSLDMNEFQNFKDSIPALKDIAEKNGLADVPLSNVLKAGDTIPVILGTAEEIKADMIIMGTKRAGWLKEIFVGSVAGEILENASCPVLAIPEEAVFDGTIDKIAVTTDYSEESCQTVHKVLEWAKYFDAEVYCLHVDITQVEDITHEMELFKEKVGEAEHLHFVSLNGREMEAAIVRHADRENIDILAMLTHKRGFLEELFHYSRAKKMTYHSSIPILTFQAHALA